MGDEPPTLGYIEGDVLAGADSSSGANVSGDSIHRADVRRARVEALKASHDGIAEIPDPQPHSKHKNAETVQASRKKTAPIAMRLPWNAYAQPADLPYSQNPSDQLSLNCPSQNNSQKRVRVMSQLQSCARLPKVRRSFQSIRASTGRYSRDENYSSICRAFPLAPQSARTR